MNIKDIPDSMKLYTLQEAAEILKVNPRSVHRYKKDGRLETKKIGGRLRISQEALERFIKGNEGERNSNVQ